MTALLEDVLGCKWSWSVLRAVHAGTTRPGQLERTIQGISTKVLNERLRKLVAHGVLLKTEFATLPPRVEYAFSDFGRSFYAVLEQIDALEWARANTTNAERVTPPEPGEPATTPPGNARVGAAPASRRAPRARRAPAG